VPHETIGRNFRFKSIDACRFFRNFLEYWHPCVLNLFYLFLGVKIANCDLLGVNLYCLHELSGTGTAVQVSSSTYFTPQSASVVVFNSTSAICGAVPLPPFRPPPRVFSQGRSLRQSLPPLGTSMGGSDRFVALGDAVLLAPRETRSAPPYGSSTFLRICPMNPLFSKCATCSSNSGGQMAQGFCRVWGTILSTSWTWGHQCPHWTPRDGATRKERQALIGT